jgi:hypothetical protein
LARLPRADKAIIESEKLSGYILSSVYPVGRFKATLFRKLGYTSENWELFGNSLRELILTHDATEVEESRYGKKYIVEGPLAGPSGDTMQVVTVWIILKDETIPRFITAYQGGSR